jgi:hypothetical protein
MSFQTLSPDFRESLRQMADGLRRPVQIRIAGFEEAVPQPDKEREHKEQPGIPMKSISGEK